MGKIGYGYGSEWHLLRYLGYHRDCLQNSILQSIEGNQIHWLDFPFSSVNKPLQHDKEWQGIDFIENSNVQEKWDMFWPKRGKQPNWDAVGKFTGKKGDEWLLVEAKAHLKEIRSCCKAKSPESKKKINEAMRASQASFGSKVPPEQWLSPYYQLCNRLSVLHFLMCECDPSIPTHLVFIYFYGDINCSKSDCSQSREDWENEIQKTYETLGLDKDSDLFHQHIHKIFLPVIPQLTTKPKAS